MQTKLYDVLTNVPPDMEAIKRVVAQAEKEAQDAEG